MYGKFSHWEILWEPVLSKPFPLLKASALLSTSRQLSGVSANLLRALSVFLKDPLCPQTVAEEFHTFVPNVHKKYHTFCIDHYS